MDFKTLLEKDGNIIKNTKGGLYHSSACESNLDLFSGSFRNQEYDTIATLFAAAYQEDPILAIENFLNIMDIRGGKGERYVTKILISRLIKINKSVAKNLIEHIGELSRFDYLLEYFNTELEENVINYISNKIKEDLNNLENGKEISLLGKWLPSLRTHKKNNKQAQKLAIAMFGENKPLAEKQYRKTLKKLRDHLNIIEKNLTEKNYNTINYELVPTKAMLKYKNAFARNDEINYNKYLKLVSTGDKKINTKGLYCYDIVKKILKKEYTNLSDEEVFLFNNMWENQEDVLQGSQLNMLIMADTSGSMYTENLLPISTSMGLAIYLAERNKGFFHNYFMTFDDVPHFQKIKGTTIVDKIQNIDSIIGTTNIDTAMDLIITTAKKNNIEPNEMPSHLVIISDMEFDQGCYSQNQTNLSEWKKSYKESGYNMPRIIFWNVAETTQGYPATKFDRDVAMISGYSTQIFKHLLDLENYTPSLVMRDSLLKYEPLALQLLDK